MATSKKSHIIQENGQTILRASKDDATPLEMNKPVKGKGILTIESSTHMKQIEGFSEIRIMAKDVHIDRCIGEPDEGSMIHTHHPLTLEEIDHIRTIHGDATITQVETITTLTCHGNLTLGQNNTTQFMDQVARLEVHGTLALVNTNISSLTPSYIYAEKLQQEATQKQRLEVIHSHILTYGGHLEHVNNCSITQPGLPHKAGQPYGLLSHAEILTEEAPLVLQGWLTHLEQESIYLRDALRLTLHQMAEEKGLPLEIFFLFNSPATIIEVLCEATHQRFADFLTILEKNYQLDLPHKHEIAQYSFKEILASQGKADYQLIILSVYEDLARNFGQEFPQALQVLAKEQHGHADTQNLRKIFAESPLNDIFQQIYLQVSEEASRTAVFALESHGFYSGTDVAIAEHSDIVRHGLPLYRAMQDTLGKKFHKGLKQSGLKDAGPFTQIEYLLTQPWETIAKQWQWTAKEKTRFLDCLKQQYPFLAIEKMPDVSLAYLLYQHNVPKSHADAKTNSLEMTTAIHSLLMIEGDITLDYADRCTLYAEKMAIRKESLHCRAHPIGDKATLFPQGEHQPSKTITQATSMDALAFSQASSLKLKAANSE